MPAMAAKFTPSSEQEQASLKVAALSSSRRREARFSGSRLAGRQVCRFPIHRHPNPGTATWVIEEDKFLEWGRIEFAISAQLQRDFGHAIRFSSGVDSKSVGFPLGDAHERVQKWSQGKNECAQDQDKQWQSGRIGNAADAPFFSPAFYRCFKQSASEREPGENKNSKKSYELRAMVEHIMTHFMCHNLANFRERTLLEQVIVQRNARRAEKSRDVCAYSRGLTRGVHFKDLFHRDFIRAGHRQNRVSDLRIA